MHFVCLTRITSEHAVKGGMEVHQKVLAEGLAVRGHQVTVLTTRGADGFVGERIIEGVKYIFTDTPRFKQLANWYPLWYREDSNLLESIHSNTPIDLVWAEGGSGIGAMRVLPSLNLPYVPIAQGTIPGDLLSYFRQMRGLKAVVKFMIWTVIKTYIWARYERKYLKNAARVIAVSNELKNEIVNYYKLPREHVTVIYNGVSPKVFKPDQKSGEAIRELLKIPQSAHVAIGAGRLIREKGFHIAIRALSQVIKEHSDIYLIILGKGRYEEELKELAVKLNVSQNVIFAGFISRDEINSYYNAADCMLAPTLRNEGFPLIFCEGMLAGLPVIASNYGGNASAVTHGETGILLSDVTPDALAKEWSDLITDKSKLQEYSENALKKAGEHFTDEQMVQQTESVFKEICAA